MIFRFKVVAGDHRMNSVFEIGNVLKHVGMHQCALAYFLSQPPVSNRRNL